MATMKTARGRRWTHSLLASAASISASIVILHAQSGGAPAGQPAMAAPLAGSPAAGKTLFEGAGSCSSCHRVGAAGSIVGPNLSDVGSRLSPEALKDRLLNPDVKPNPRNRLYEIALNDGKQIQGKLLNQDSLTLQMLNTNGDLLSLRRSDIREGHFTDPPQMPSFQGKLTSAQIDDLVAYLASLRTSDGR